MKLKITVHGVAYEVDVEVLDPGEGFPPSGVLPKVRPVAAKPNGRTPLAPPSGASTPPAAPGSDNSVASPIAGTIIEIKCKVGESITKGQVLLVIEAMKMKTSIAAPASGKVKAIPVAAGDSVRESQVLVELE